MKSKPRQYKAACWHLRVNINAIIKAVTSKSHYRVVAGNCQDCSERVLRAELRNGMPMHPWLSTKEK